MADNGRNVSPIPFSPGQELQTRILIIAIRAIGDVVLISPLLPLLKKAYPTGYLSVLVDGPTAEVLANNPSIDRLIPIHRSESQRETCWKRGQNWVHLIRDIRNERFDVVIDVFSGPRSAILPYLSGDSEQCG
jgi:ADP-heptose:LPS heptosyltransferase